MKTTKHKKFLVQWILHGSILLVAFNVSSLLLYWLRIVFEGPYLLKSNGQYVTFWDRFVMQNFYQDTILLLFYVALLAEVGLHYAFAKRKMIWFIFYCAFAGICWVVYLRLQNAAWPFTQMLYQYITIWFYGSLYVFLYTVFRDFLMRRARDKKLALAGKEAELRELRTQVNPHFFFNTLNGVYGLALAEKATLTSKAIERLSDMMRYTMDQSVSQTVSLTDEFAFVWNYIELQKIRIGDEVKLDVHINTPPTKYRIPPLLLIPFIENAFQYGISRNSDSFIQLSLQCINNLLKLEISNSVNAGHTIHGHGTGITNTKRRLDLIYPDHQLTIDQSSHQYNVYLTIPL